jgi:hypothetical protein
MTREQNPPYPLHSTSSVHALLKGAKKIYFYFINKLNMKYKLLFPLFFIFSFLISKSALAVCPVCTVAVGVGVGLSRWIGIDDRITGFWIGGLIMSVSLWTIDWLNRKEIRFKGRKILVIAFMYIVTIMPLYSMDIIGHPFNKFCGLDKIVFGVLIGSFVFILGNILNLYLKSKNGGKVYFPFQKVAAPIGLLLVASLTMYVIIAIFKC